MPAGGEAWSLLVGAATTIGAVGAVYLRKQRKSTDSAEIDQAQAFRARVYAAHGLHSRAPCVLDVIPKNILNFTQVGVCQ